MGGRAAGAFAIARVVVVDRRVRRKQQGRPTVGTRRGQGDGVVFIWFDGRGGGGQGVRGDRRVFDGLCDDVEAGKEREVGGVRLVTRERARAAGGSFSPCVGSLTVA